MGDTMCKDIKDIEYLGEIIPYPLPPALLLGDDPCDYMFPYLTDLNKRTIERKGRGYGTTS
tara:strand:+ start:57 stop:239 length:183 start_codon:yes stop_codon:yes gene_type:complete